MSFPTDEITLSIVEVACQPDGDAPSSLTEVLTFGSEHTHTDEDGVRYLEGGWHPNDVILALIAEVRRLRARVE